MVRAKKSWRANRANGADVAVFLVLTVIMLAVFLPFWNCFVTSFQSQADYNRNPMALWPRRFSLENYKAVFTGNSILVGYKSTLIITIGTTIYAMFLNATMAFCFSRTREHFPGKTFFFVLILIPMYIGGGVVPTYLLMKNLKLINTYAGIILMSGASTYNIIIMKNGYEEMRSLEEAACIDGANDIQMFVRILLPLQKPLMATFTLFTMVGAWNSWYWPMILLNDFDKMTLQQILRNIVVTASARTTSTMASASGGVEAERQLFSQGIKMASVFVTMLPIMLVYPFLQKYFAKGVMVGAIKM